MSMLRKLIATLAVATWCMGNPVKADYSVCWFEQEKGQEEIPSQPCDIEIVTENDTKYIYIFTPSDGATMKLALYYTPDDKPAYVNLYEANGKKVGSAFFRIDEEGHIHVYNSEFNFYFAWPEDRTTAPAPVEAGVLA